MFFLKVETLMKVLILLVCLFFINFQLRMVFCKDKEDYDDVSMHSRRTRTNFQEALFDKDPQQFMINCSNRNEIETVKVIGKGMSKTTFLAKYQGQYLAVKVVTPNQQSVKSCVKTLRSADADNSMNRPQCFGLSKMRLMKEILLLQSLRHPNLVQLRGYCVNGGKYFATDVVTNGDFSVFEFGVPVEFRNMNWEDCIKHSLALSRLLQYLEHSVLGHLGHTDLTLNQFRMINSAIKMTDLDAIVSFEPRCRLQVHKLASHQNEYTPCKYGLPCQKGRCVGHNSRHMFKLFTSIFFTEMFQLERFPLIMRPHINELQKIINSSTASSKDLMLNLQALQTKLNI